MYLRMTSLAFVVLVAASATVDPPQSLRSGTPPAATAAMRAYIDPATGELLPEVPPGEARRQLPIPSLEPDDSKIEVLNLPDGTRGVLFHGQRQATIVATLDKDGTPQTECIESTAAQPNAPQTSNVAQRHDQN
jgi:hypothetical protein